MNRRRWDALRYIPRQGQTSSIRRDTGFHNPVPDEDEDPTTASDAETGRFQVSPSRRGSRGTIDTLTPQGTNYAYRIPLIPSVPCIVGAAFLGALAGIVGGPIGVLVMARVMRIPYAIASTSMHSPMVVQSAVVVAMHLLADHQGPADGGRSVARTWRCPRQPARSHLRGRLGEGPLTRTLALGLFFIALRTARAGPSALRAPAPVEFEPLEGGGYHPAEARLGGLPRYWERSASWLTSSSSAGTG